MSLSEPAVHSPPAVREAGCGEGSMGQLAARVSAYCQRQPRHTLMNCMCAVGPSR